MSVRVTTQGTRRAKKMPKRNKERAKRKKQQRAAEEKQYEKETGGQGQLLRQEAKNKNRASEVPS